MNQESITHEIIMQMFGKLEFHNGDCYCGECDTRLFAELKSLEFEYYAKLYSLEESKNTVGDEAMTNDWSILNESCRYYLTEENCTEIKSALRLQELVKEEIVNRNHRGHKSVQTFKWSQLYARMLQSILNESQITPGVEGTQ